MKMNKQDSQSRNYAPMNRTLACSDEEIDQLCSRLLHLSHPATVEEITGQVINQDFADACSMMPVGCVDLLIIDPPYNLTKNFNSNIFRQRDSGAYETWFDSCISTLAPLLSANATIYVCSDWKTSTSIFPVLERHFTIRNRITWEREKGRGAKTNWKNNTEDIWFCTVGKKYVFNVEAVKLKKKVLAPYRNEEGNPKDWRQENEDKYRLTHPSNFWSDITIPFWSMPENTNHPTQKPEKLIAKLILASSNQYDLVFDPFLGSGTTAVVAKKLGRKFCGVEINKEYCSWALKRLDLAQRAQSIQGYHDGVFWERNSLPKMQK